MLEVLFLGAIGFATQFMVERERELEANRLAQALERKLK